MSASSNAIRITLGLFLLMSGVMITVGCTSSPKGSEGYYTGSADYDSGGLPSRRRGKHADPYLPTGGYYMDPKTGKLKYTTNPEELTSPEGVDRKSPSREP